MSFVLYCMLFGIVVFCPETETAIIFSSTPPNPSYAVEGNNFTLKWDYTLDGSLTAASFSNVTGGADDSIASRNGPGKINSTQKYAARFRAQATNNRADLTILAVQLSDEGTYKLNLVSSAPTFISNEAKVIVHSPPSDIVTSSDRSVIAPAVLTLSCSAVGKPEPQITWTRVSDNSIISMPLNIVRGKNEESYQCTASNGVGNAATKVVKITILFSPKVILAQKVFVGREQNASLKCEVEGNPAPTFSWSPCDVRNLLCDKQHLNISKVQSARANYTCIARNDLGNDSATVILLIGGKRVYVRLSVSGECYNKDSVWKKLLEELDKVFAKTPSYSGAELIEARCGSLIFDVVIKFSTEFAEDDTISIIQNAIEDGKLGELSVNVSHIIGIPPVEQTTIAAPTSTTPKPEDNKTVLIICAVLGSVASVALIGFIIWYVRKKKCCSESKEVSDGTDAAQGRKGKGPNGADEVTYASTSMLPNSKRPLGKTNQSTVQALPMYAQVDKTKKTSNKGGAAQRQRQRQPGELQYAEVEHVPSGKSLPRKSSSEPIKPSNEEIVYADLV